MSQPQKTEDRAKLVESSHQAADDTLLFPHEQLLWSEQLQPADSCIGMCFIVFLGLSSIMLLGLATWFLVWNVQLKRKDHNAWYNSNLPAAAYPFLVMGIVAGFLAVGIVQIKGSMKTRLHKLFVTNMRVYISLWWDHEDKNSYATWTLSVRQIHDLGVNDKGDQILYCPGDAPTQHDFEAMLLASAVKKNPLLMGSVVSDIEGMREAIRTAKSGIDAAESLLRESLPEMSPRPKNIASLKDSWKEVVGDAKVHCQGSVDKGPLRSTVVGTSIVAAIIGLVTILFLYLSSGHRDDGARYIVLLSPLVLTLCCLCCCVRLSSFRGQYLFVENAMLYYDHSGPIVPQLVHREPLNRSILPLQISVRAEPLLKGSEGAVMLTTERDPRRCMNLKPHLRLLTAYALLNTTSSEEGSLSNV